ncbi:transcription antitermination factor NusB [Psychrobacter sp. DM4]|uniref:transcription antitermination factor NusB n=1 Tax=Psychrobacter sp. DM4 TaxID=3440637 RepID=UPI003F50596A
MTDQLKRALNDAQTDSITQTPARDDEQHFDVSESSYKTSHTAVRKARRFAMQGLYEWLVTDRRFDTTDKRSWLDNAPYDIAARTRATNAMHTVHIGYYHEMMRDIPEQIEALDTLIAEQLDRGIEKLDTVEHAILLIGAYELQHRLEIPYKVVLDEAMKLNNHFGATDAHKLINAVLDRMAIELRALEVQADTKANLRTSQKAATKQAKASQNESQTAVQSETQTDEPTASNKPRISANKTGVKRDRLKPSSATATKQAIQKASAQPIQADDLNSKDES